MEWMILPLKRYADFSGRSRRQEFWLYTLFVIILWFAVFTVAGALFGATMAAVGENANPFSVLSAMGSGFIAIIGVIIILWLALFIPGLAVSVRRMHDTGRSGWWAGVPVMLYYGSSLVQVGLIAVISDTAAILSAIIALAWFVSAIAFLIFACLEGTRGPNRYGTDPKNPEASLDEVFS